MLLLYGVYFFVFVEHKFRISDDSQTHKNFDANKKVHNSSILIPHTLTYSIFSRFKATFFVIILITINTGTVVVHIRDDYEDKL